MMPCRFHREGRAIVKSVLAVLLVLGMTGVSAADQDFTIQDEDSNPLFDVDGDNGNVQIPSGNLDVQNRFQTRRASDTVGDAGNSNPVVYAGRVNVEDGPMLVSVGDNGAGEGASVMYYIAPGYGTGNPPKVIALGENDQYPSTISDINVYSDETNNDVSIAFEHTGGSSGSSLTIKSVAYATDLSAPSSTTLSDYTQRTVRKYATENYVDTNDDTTPERGEFGNADDLDAQGDVTGLSDFTVDDNDVSEDAFQDEYLDENSDDTMNGNLEVNTIDTGNGNYEIGQNLRTTDAVIFDGITSNSNVDIGDNSLSFSDTSITEQSGDHLLLQGRDPDQQLRLTDGGSLVYEEYQGGGNAFEVDSQGGADDAAVRLGESGGNVPLDLNSNNINNIGGLQSCGDNEFVDGNGNCQDAGAAKTTARFTSTDTSTDINKNSWTVIPWNLQLDISSGYTHDPSGSPGQITFEESGTYKVHTMLTYSDGNSRTNPGIKFSINGNRRDRVGLSGYTRNREGHDEASNYLTEMIDVNAGDTLRVESKRFASGGTSTLIDSASVLVIQKVSETVPKADDVDKVDGFDAADLVNKAGDTMTGDLDMGNNNIDYVETLGSDGSTNIDLVDGGNVAIPNGDLTMAGDSTISGVNRISNGGQGKEDLVIAASSNKNNVIIKGKGRPHIVTTGGATGNVIRFIDGAGDGDGSSTALDINDDATSLAGNNLNNIGGLQNCGSDEFVNGNGDCTADSNTNTQNPINADLVAGNGLSGGSNNVLPGGDSDVTVSLSADDLDNQGNINDFSAASDLNQNGDITSFDDASDLNSNGDISSFDNANDLDSSGSLQSNTVADNEIDDNTVDNSEIQNNDRFTFNGVDTNANIDMNGNNIVSSSNGFQIDFDENTREKAQWYGSDYTTGVESSTLFFESGGRFRWYANSQNHDGGTSEHLQLDSNELLLSRVNLDANGNNIINPNEVDGIDLDNPGNALTTDSNNGYAVQSNSIDDEELVNNGIDAGDIGSGAIGNSELDNDEQFRFSDTSSGPMVDLQGGNSGYNGLDISMDDDNSNNDYGLRVRFEDGSIGSRDTGGDVAFTVQPNENSPRIGIDTSNPSNTLDVGGSARFNSLVGDSSGNQCGADQFLNGNGDCTSASDPVEFTNINDAGSDVTIGSVDKVNVDEGAGLRLESPSSNTATLSMGSHWKEIYIDGTEQLVPSGQEPLNLATNNELSITADSTANPQKLSFDINAGNVLSNANDLDSSGNLESNTVGDNEITDNTVDSSEIQNGATFSMDALRSVSDQNAIRFADGDSRITNHDGHGNFNIRTGTDNSNNIVAGTGGTHIRMDENGGVDIEVDESTGTGNTMGEDIGLSVNGGSVDIRGGSLDMNSNEIVGLSDPTDPQDAATRSYVNDNDDFEADNQGLPDVLNNDNTANNKQIRDFDQLVTGRGGRVATFNNPSGGSSEIRFRSGENSGSDYGYIKAIDDENNNGENFGLTLGTENDPASGSNDHITLRPAGDLYLRPGDAGSGKTTNFGNLDMNSNEIVDANRLDLDNGAVIDEGTADYGSIRVRGGADSGWDGVNVEGGDDYVFMVDDNSDAAGLYDDTDNNWHVYMDGSETQLRYNGNTKIETRGDGINIRSGANSEGLNVDGSAAVTGTTGNGWLRLNQDSAFSNGVYTPGKLRADGNVNLDNSDLNEVDQVRGYSNNDVEFLDRPRSQDGLYIDDGTAYFDGEIRTDVIQDRSGGNTIRSDSNINMNGNGISNIGSTDIGGNGNIDFNSGGSISSVENINVDSINSNKGSDPVDMDQGIDMDGSNIIDDNDNTVNVNDNLNVANNLTVNQNTDLRGKLTVGNVEINTEVTQFTQCGSQAKTVQISGPTEFVLNGAGGGNSERFGGSVVSSGGAGGGIKVSYTPSGTETIDIYVGCRGEDGREFKNENPSGGAGRFSGGDGGDDTTNNRFPSGAGGGSTAVVGPNGPIAVAGGGGGAAGDADGNAGGGAPGGQGFGQGSDASGNLNLGGDGGSSFTDPGDDGGETANQGTVISQFTGNTGDGSVKVIGTSTNIIETANADITGNLTVGQNTEIEGDLTVDGSIDNTADVAEVMEKRDRDADIEAGDVVAVKQGEVTKNTSGSNLNMVVSAKPGVRLGGQVSQKLSQEEQERLEEKRLDIAFTGRVPTKILGDAESGDYVMPSGGNNGTAVAVPEEEIGFQEYKEAVGVVLERFQVPEHMSKDNTEEYREVLEEAEGETYSIYNVAVGVK